MTYRQRIQAGRAQAPIEIDAAAPRATWPTLVFALVGALIIAAGAIFMAVHGG